MGEDAALAALFLKRRAGSAVEPAALAAALRRAVDDGRRAWPDLGLGDERFVAYLADRLRPDDEPLATLAALALGDLYLACAVVDGSAAAVAAFERTLLSRVGQFIGRVDAAPPFVAEVTQALRIKLLVGSDGVGRLSQYSGRGPLASWICAAALRTAYDLQRTEQRQPARDDGELDVLAASDDPELELLRRRYGGELRQALREALAALDSRSRTLLRLYFLERLTQAQIGHIYRVHETTALRWIAQSRQTVLEHVRATVRRTLQVSAHECDELMGLLGSRLDVTVRRLLDGSSSR